MRKKVLNELVDILKDYNNWQLFDSRNTVGDKLSVVYFGDGVELSICKDYEYFEVLGLEEKEVEKLYKMCGVGAFNCMFFGNV